MPSPAVSRPVRVRQLPSLDRVLAAVPAATLDQMQRTLLAHRPLFLWSAALGGMAYNLTMHELCWRARYRRAGVDCRALLPPARQTRGRPRE